MLTHTVYDLNPGTLYQFQVAANNSAGQSEFVLIDATTDFTCMHIITFFFVFNYLSGSNL